MKQKLSVLIFILFFFCTLISAQEWSKEDSIWLKNVLEGKEELIINDETKKAIEEGRLIMPSWMRNVEQNSNLELLMDFENIGVPDDSLRIRNFDPLTMPPAVFALYVLYLDKMDSIFNINALMLTEEARKILETQIPTGSFYPHTSDYSPGFSLRGMDFNHSLSMIFSAKYRQTSKLRQNATAYKGYYNNGIAPGKISFSEQERKQLNNIVNSKRPSVKVTYGRRMNGVDD